MIPGCCSTSSKKRASWGSSVPDRSRASTSTPLDLARAIGDVRRPGPRSRQRRWPPRTRAVRRVARGDRGAPRRPAPAVRVPGPGGRNPRPRRAGGGRVRASRGTGARRAAAGQLRSRRRPVVRAPPRSRPSARSGSSGAGGSLVVTEPPDGGRGVDAVGQSGAHGARVRRAAPDPGRRDGCRADPVGRDGGRSLAAPRRRPQQTTALVTTGQSALVSGQPPTRKKSRPVMPGTPTTPGSGPTFQRRCPVAALTAR